MSIFLQNYVQLLQSARNKPLQPLIRGGVDLMRDGEFIVGISYLQIIIIVLTLLLMAVFSFIITRTKLGREQRACEQDRDMAALVGVDVERTISLTFIIGASRAGVAVMHFKIGRATGWERG